MAERQDDDGAMLRQLVEGAPCGLGLLDRDFRFHWANDYLVRLAGLTDAQNVQAVRLHDLVTPASRIFLQTRLRQELILGGRLEELALDLVTPAGDRVPVMINAVQTVVEGEAGSIRLSVSRAPVRRAYEAEVPKARQAAEAASQAARAIITGFVIHCPVPLVMTDRHLVVTGVSRAWEAAYGQSADRVVGHRLDQREDEVRPPDPMWAAIYERALAGESLRSETPARSAYSDSWFEWAVIPWRDADGDVGGLLLMNFDVSDLIRARDAAAAADEAKSRFLANMSHELRTPLNSVLAPIELLRGFDLDPGVRAHLDTVGRAGADLARTLTTILDFSNIETDTFEVARAAFDPAELWDRALASCAGDLMGRDVTLTGTVWEVGRRLVGDPDAVLRILVQLVSNAIKFTAAGQVAVELERIDDEIVFSVRDTGCGFEEAQFPQMMRPFHQRDVSMTRAQGGTGLGLALANALAQAIGGRITASSVVGSGSRVSLSIPLEWADDLDRQDGVEPDRPSGSLRILAVDDNPANLAVIGAVLGMIDAEVVYATNGLEAVERAAVETFDLILMDVQMPVMDGLTAIRTLRSRERGGARKPILVISANVSRPEIAAALAAGADDVLGKPIGAASLIQTISRLLVGVEMAA